MSLNLPLIGAATTAPPPASATARSSETAPTGAGSFGEALSRATQPASPDAAAPRGKGAAATSTQRPAGTAETETDIEEPAEPALAPALAMMLALESRSAPPTLHAGARTTAQDGRPGQEVTIADPLAPSLASAAVAADDTIGLPAAGTDAKGSALPAAALALALDAAGPKQRGQASVTTDFKTDSEGNAPVGDAGAAETAPSSNVRDMAVSELLLPRSSGSPGASVPTGTTGTRAGTALPPAALAAASHAASAAPTSGEAVLSTADGTPALLVSSVEAGAVPVPAMTAPAMQGPAGMGSSAPLPLNTPSLPQDIGSSEWGEALGQQVLQMGKAGQEVAELQLNPPGLGPLKVTLSMNEHQLQAAFVSTHSSVRAAVEAALPQLRAALADNGISLGNTSVGAESRQPSDANQGQGERPAQRAFAGDSVARGAASASDTPVRQVRNPGNGNSVDLYA